MNRVPKAANEPATGKRAACRRNDLACQFNNTLINEDGKTHELSHSLHCEIKYYADRHEGKENRPWAADSHYLSGTNPKTRSCEDDCQQKSVLRFDGAQVCRLHMPIDPPMAIICKCRLLSLLANAVLAVRRAAR